MFRIYFKVALRNLLRNRLYAAVNILGLSVGIAVSIIVFLYIQSEITYDKYHPNRERIYRITSNFVMNEERERTAVSSHTLGPQLKQYIPEIEASTRMSYISQSQMSSPYATDEEDHLLAADENLFKVFKYKLQKGDPETCLREPNQIVLSESMAEKYFPQRDPMGQTVVSGSKRVYTVTGVVEDIPENTHHYFNALISMSSVPKEEVGCEDGYDISLWSASVYTFLLLQEGYAPKEFYADFADFYESNMAAVGKKLHGYFYPVLQPLDEVHLGTQLDYDFFEGGNPSYIYGFAAIGLFLMLLAAINYTNMATARSTTRTREVGLRKVMGSRRRQLVVQFLGESLLTSLIALLLALALVEVILEFTPFNELMRKHLRLDLVGNPTLAAGVLLMTVTLGIFSGLYPAFYLSSVSPSRAFRPRQRSAGKGRSLRRALVVFQFTISIGVIIATFLMKNQVDYMRNVNLGYNDDNTIVQPLYDTTTVKNLPALRAELEALPGVVATTTARHVPGGNIGRMVFRVEKTNGMPEVVSDFMEVGPDFIEGMDLQLVSGEGFGEVNEKDTTFKFIVNQAAAREYFDGDALGKEINFGLTIGNAKIKRGTVVGVVKDFNVHSLRYQMRPLIMKPNPLENGMLYVRMEADQVVETIEKVGKVWEMKTTAETPFTPFFITEKFEKLYSSDRRLSSLMSVLASLCILISILGLLGFASYSIEQRRKEIGVRKVLGASIAQIVGLLFREVFYLVLFSSLLGSILAYLVVQLWLEQFAYHAEIPMGTFFFAGVLSIILAFITVSYHSIRAAVSNPVHALKYE